MAQSKKVIAAGAKDKVLADTNSAYFEWAPVLAGSAVATAISVVFVQFGTAVGLVAGEPLLANGTPSWNVLPTGLWFVLTAIASASAGAYLAGRMRVRHVVASAHEAEFRDGVHGLVVWAVSSILAAFAISVISFLATLGVAEIATQQVTPSSRYLQVSENISIILGFSTGAGAMLSAAAAWFFAIMGGTHRDEDIDVHMLVPRMFRKA